MKEKLLYLLEEKYPDKKFIFWGHNFHIMKETQRLEMVDDGLKDFFNPRPDMLGTIIPNELKEDSYVLGVYMDHGTSWMEKEFMKWLQRNLMMNWNGF